MTEYQLDIFGNEVPVKILSKMNQKKTSCKSIKTQFRERKGYNPRQFCGDCKYYKEYKGMTRYYGKCEKIGNGRNTDIEENNKACKLYEEKERI